jgi:hypothetical protein
MVNRFLAFAKHSLVPRLERSLTLLLTPRFGLSPLTLTLTLTLTLISPRPEKQVLARCSNCALSHGCLTFFQ